MWRLMAMWLMLCCTCHPSLQQKKVHKCGGILTERTGIIQTPGFPKPFPVPIQCQWIIYANATEIVNKKVSIVVYLTQLYSTMGLTFTQMADYHMSYSLKIHTVTEEDAEIVKWVETKQPTLVLDFEMDRLEGNHLRVLDHLLDVYGFNLTYEISDKEDPVRESCNVMSCSYVGNCYASAEFTDYYCSCFKGYSGPQCGTGPLCESGRHICQNGATCRHIGSTAVFCNCTPGYTGNTCDIKVPDPEDAECGEGGCFTQCPYKEGSLEICNCGHRPRIPTERVRYEGTVRVANMTALQEVYKQNSIESVLQKQILKSFKNYSISKMDELKVINITAGGEVTFNFLGGKKDGSKVREALNRLVERGRLGNITLVPTRMAVRQQPTLLLQNVRVNQFRPIRENEEFILSCEAQGSSFMTFRWFKDGIFVNESKSVRTMWTRLLPMDSQDLYTALLGIERATRLDEGVYTCQVTDWGMQQCKSLKVEVMVPPQVKVVPMSITLNRGDDASIKCVVPSEQQHEKFGYNWTKNKKLFPMVPGKEVWEDLSPDGSILRIYNVQKSAVYTCLVQGSLASQSVSVQVEVVNSSVVPLCDRDHSQGVVWPCTAPAQLAVQVCPSHYTGLARRLCSLKDTGIAAWDTPDFSSCVSPAVSAIHDKFRSLMLGYQGTTGSATLHEILHYLTTLKTLLPGGGEIILDVMKDVHSYLNITCWKEDILNCTQTFYHIMSLVLGSTQSLVNQQKVTELQDLVKSHAVLWGSLLTVPGAAHAQYSSLVVYVAALDSTLPHRLYFPSRAVSVPSWVSDRIDIHIEKFGNGSFATAVVIYKNLAQFLPMRYAAKLKNDSEVEYELNSHIVTVELGQVPPSGSFWVDVELDHIVTDYDGDKWQVMCGISSQNTWDLEFCRTHTLSMNVSRCRCSRAGSYAVLLATKIHLSATSPATNYHTVVVVGCACCLFQAVLTLLLLLPYWWHHRSCLIFIKLQCCTATTGAMGVFIYAVRDSVPKTSFPYVTTSLEGFLLIGMSSHLSKLLIVYTEVVQIPRVSHSKQTVITIITGVPVLAVLCNHLAHHSTGWQLTSWWLICGTMLFNIFVASAAIMLLMFAFLYFTVMHKLQGLSGKNSDGNRAIKRRVGLLKRAGVIFLVMVIMEASSILYVNVPDLICHYIFSFSSAFLGFIIFLCYILKSETPLHNEVLRKLRLDNTPEEDCSSDSPLRFFTKQDADAESEGPPPRPGSSLAMQEQVSQAVGDEEHESITDNLLMVESRWTPPSEGPPSTIETCDGSIEECRGVSEKNKDDSPYKQQKNICRVPSDYMESNGGKWRWYSSDQANSTAVPRPQPGQCYIRDSSQIVTTRVCVELGVITPQQHGDQVDEDEQSPTIVLCSVDVEPCHRGLLELTPDVTSLTLTVPDKPNAPAMENETSDYVLPEVKKDSLTEKELGKDTTEKLPLPKIVTTDTEEDNVLDRISHDLDYLLNRKPQASNGNVSVKNTMSSARKTSKPPASSVRNQIKEEDEEEEEATSLLSEGNISKD